MKPSNNTGHSHYIEGQESQQCSFGRQTYVIGRLAQYLEMHVWPGLQPGRGVCIPKVLDQTQTTWKRRHATMCTTSFVDTSIIITSQYLEKERYSFLPNRLFQLFVFCSHYKHNLIVTELAITLSRI
jgi:hypothetical protein